MLAVIALVASAPVETRAAVFLVGVVCVGAALYRMARRAKGQG